MNYALFCLTVLALFAAAGLAALVRNKPEWLLWLHLAAMGFGGFNWFLGTLVFPTKVVAFCSLVYLALHLKDWTGFLRDTGNSAFWWWLYTLALAAGLAYLGPAPLGPVESRGIQSMELRPLAQAYTYTAVLGAFPLGLVAFHSRKRLRRFLDVYVGMAVLSAVAALAQLAMLRLGREFMPILRWNAEHSEVAAFSLGGAIVPRLYGFAGEPKVLAVLLLPALLIVLTSLASGGQVRRPWWARWWVLAILGVVFVCAFSTAALIAFALGLSVFLKRVLGRGLLAFAVAAAGFLAFQCVFSNVGLSFGDFDPTGSSPNLAEAVYARVVERVFEESSTLYEVRALSFLFDRKPEAIFAGLGLGMYVFHLGSTWEQGVNPINSAWVALFMDTGMLGAGLLAGWFLVIWRRGVHFQRACAFSDPELCGIALACEAGLAAAFFLNAGVGALGLLSVFGAALEAARVRIERLDPRPTTWSARSARAG